MRPGIETLRALPLFATLCPAALARLNEAGDLLRVGPEEALFASGERLKDLHILLAGFVAATHPQPGNQVAMTDVLGPVAPLCLPAALLNLPAPVGARTITSARLVLIPMLQIGTMIRDEPGLGLRFLDHALHGMQALTAENCNLKLRSSAQRLAEFLLGLAADPEMHPARFVLPYEKRYLAAKIGCSQENLSRAFAALRRLGVETQRGIVVLRDVSGLRAFAGLPPPARETV